jgi:hypothetical protein
MSSVTSFPRSVFSLRSSRVLALLILVSIMGCAGSRSLERADTLEEIIIIGEYESIDHNFLILERGQVGAPNLLFHDYDKCMIIAVKRARKLGANAIKINRVYKDDDGFGLLPYIEKCAMDLSYLRINDFSSALDIDEMSSSVPDGEALIHAEFFGLDTLIAGKYGSYDNLLFLNDYQAKRTVLKEIKDGKIRVRSDSANGFRSNSVTEYDTSEVVAVYGKDMELLYGRAPFLVRDIWSLQLEFQGTTPDGMTGFVSLPLPHGSSSYFRMRAAEYELKYVSIQSTHAARIYFDLQPQSITYDFSDGGCYSLGSLRIVSGSVEGDDCMDVHLRRSKLPLGVGVAASVLMTVALPGIWWVSDLEDALDSKRIWETPWVNLQVKPKFISDNPAFHDYSTVLRDSQPSKCDSLIIPRGE